MDSETWLTIVVPAYNTERYVPDCLASIAAVQHEDSGIGAIAVDDGSDDRTRTFLQTWALEDPARRLVLCHPHNRGLAASRNTGWAACTTPWVLWLDSDNVLSPDTTQLLAQAIASDPSTDLWIVPPGLIDATGRRFGAFYGDHVSWNPIQVMQHHPEQLLIGNLFDAMTATRRSVLPAPPWDEQLWALEDWDLWIRLLFHQQARVGMLPQETGGYRIRDGSLIRAFQANNPRYHAAWITVYAKILRDLPHLPPEARQAVAQQLQQRGAQWVATTMVSSSTERIESEPRLAVDVK